MPPQMDEFLKRQPEGRVRIAGTGAITFRALLLRRSVGA
jgi:hypothetical protein